MKLFILLCNLLIPAIMITIGILYKYRSYKKINTILDLFIPASIIGSGLGSKETVTFSTNTNLLKSSNKKCSLIWIISGLATLIITVIVLILNKSDIITSKTFLDTSNVSVIMLEVELAISVVVFVTVEFILKKTYYKKQ